MSQIESRRANHPLLIGIFVTIGTVLSISLLFWLGVTEILEEQTYYVTYFDGSVEGLETGSAVKYQGIPVGSVSEVKVAPDGELVEVLMQLDPKVKFNDSIRVKTHMSGIAGSKILQLFFSDNPVILNTHPRVNFEIPDKAIGLIKSSPSDIQEITLAAQDLINNFRELQVGQISEGTVNFLKGSTSFLDTATRFLSNKDLQRTIQNLKQTTENIRILTSNAEDSDIIENLSNTAETLYQTSVGLERFSRKLDSNLFAMNLPELLNRSYTRYDTLIQKMEQSISIITYRTEDLLISTNQTLEELKKVSRSIRKSSEEIADQPSRILAKPIKKKDK